MRFIGDGPSDSQLAEDFPNLHDSGSILRIGSIDAENMLIFLKF
jgi:hypothetical protein